MLVKFRADVAMESSLPIPLYLLKIHYFLITPDSRKIGYEKQKIVVARTRKVKTKFSNKEL